MKKIIILFICCCSCKGLLTDKTSQEAKKDIALSDSSAVHFISDGRLSGILSEEYYQIKAYFLFEDSHLELFSHFNGFQIKDGVRILFERQGESLVIKTSVQAHFEKILFEDKGYFSKNNLGDWTIAVTNGTEEGFRVRVWENFIDKMGAFKKPIEFLVQESLLADSLLENLIFYTKGTGLLWGMKLFRSRLIKGERVSPKVL